MDFVEDYETGGLTFTLSIHNFSNCVQKEDEFLDGPKFVVDSIKYTTFNLRVYPKGNGARGFISCYLMKDHHLDHELLIVYNKLKSINYVLLIRTCDGVFKGEPCKLSREKLLGSPKMLSIKDLNEPGAYLDNDTLTLRCRLWVDDNDLLTSRKCFARTKINFTKIDYLWKLDDFENKYDSNPTTDIKVPSIEIPHFTIHLFNGVSFGSDTIHFVIKLPQDKKLFLICNILLLDADGKIAHSVQGEYLFPNSNETQIWNLPFLSKHKLLSKKELYLPNGRLTLRCTFSASTGVVQNEIVKYEDGITEHIKLRSSERMKVNQSPDPAHPWTANMLQSYKEGKFSDVTICTHSAQFPVNKAIVCAQSEVFSAMFESDMKEKRTGVVEIKDLEDDTVSKMLMFLHTNILEELDFSIACNLYSAADKYHITALRKMCSNFLTSSLDTSNVCDVLALANRHQGEELKTIARDFIFDHDREILNSEDWKKLMKVEASLTSETMHLMICKKFLGGIPNT